MAKEKRTQDLRDVLEALKNQAKNMLDLQKGDAFLSLLMDKNGLSFNCVGYENYLALGLMNVMNQHPGLFKAFLGYIKDVPGFVQSVLMMIQTTDYNDLHITDADKMTLAESFQDIANNLIKSCNEKRTDTPDTKEAD